MSFVGFNMARTSRDFVARLAAPLAKKLVRLTCSKSNQALWMGADSHENEGCVRDILALVPFP